MELPPGVSYQHTQNSPQWVVVVASLFAIVMFSLSVTLIRSDSAPLWVSFFIIVWAGVIYLAVLNFTRLTTSVSAAEIDLVWRLGWPRKSIDRASVTEIGTHRNSWLEGWGIRKVRRGWMWNVWGLDSVELLLDSGKTFRIGTDDTDTLLEVLKL